MDKESILNINWFDVKTSFDREINTGLNNDRTIITMRIEIESEDESKKINLSSISDIINKSQTEIIRYIRNNFEE